MASIILRRQAAAVPSIVHRCSLFTQETVGLPAIASQFVQLRLFSDARINHASSPSPPSNPSPGYIYEAPFSSAVRKVKRLSLFSCFCALGAGPVIMGLDAGSTFTATVSIAGTLASFGIFTTGLLHWFTSPYTHKLVYDPKTESIDVTTLDMLGRSRTQTIKVADVKEADSVHPLSSFGADGKIFYLDKDYFVDKALLERLIPSPVTPESQSTTEGKNSDASS